MFLDVFLRNEIDKISFVIISQVFFILSFFLKHNEYKKIVNCINIEIIIELMDDRIFGKMDEHNKKK